MPLPPIACVSSAHIARTHSRQIHLWLVALFAGAVASGCSSAEETAEAHPAAHILALLDHPCNDALDSVYEDATPPADWDASKRGTLVRCGYDRLVGVDEMVEHYSSNDFIVPSLSTGFHKLRVSYWTERGPGEPVITSGDVFIPEERRADPSPLIVMGHGSVGVSDQCAPSREEQIGFHRSWRVQAHAFAGDGWIVMHPDFPGLGTPGHTTWTHSPDNGHALLDGTRSARRLFKEGQLSSKNALVGHSAGGHAVLSAASYTKDYGTEGTLESVVAYNSFWLPNSTWGALISPAGAALINDVFMSMTMQYYTGHLAAYEGEQHAYDAFLPDKRDEVAALLESGCWLDIVDGNTGPSSIGANLGADVFTQEYLDEVGICGFTGNCESELAATWKARWVADRPPIDDTVPIVYVMGMADDFNSPDFQQCGIDRMIEQGADVQICAVEGGEHTTVIPMNIGWVRDHLAAKLLDAPAPAACPGYEALAEAPTCTLPITNSSDPSEP